MTILWKLAGLAFAAVLASSSVAAAAQGDPGIRDRVYKARGTEKMPTNKTDQEIAIEENAARAVEAACGARDLDACSDLGEAYEFGRGKPQNRPVAGILYSEGCEAGHATSCYRFGRVTSVANYDDAGKDASAIYRQACDLGSLDGCAAYAVSPYSRDGIENFDLFADTLLRDNCRKGGRLACRELAVSILNADSPEAEIGMAFDLLERGCREGRAKDCAAYISYVHEREPSSVKLTVSEALYYACLARDALSCLDLGNMALNGEKTPESHQYASQLHDLACEYADDVLEKSFCETAEMVRSEPAVKALCESGDIQACARLGEIYDWAPSGLHDARKAGALLERACLGGVARTCNSAALKRLELVPQPDAKVTLELLESGCAADQESACETLAKELDSGDRLARDQLRSYALYSDLCAGGSPMACTFLEDRGRIDPSAPLPVADARYIPPIDPDDDVALAVYYPEDTEGKPAKHCVSSSVEFRGRVYSDVVCDPGLRMRKGYPLEPGAAPWQALLWRPEKNERGTYSKAARVACGGTVIQRGWILTAAHCLVEKRGNKYFKVKYGDLVNGYTVRLGVHNPRNDEGLIYPIEDVHLHPKFNLFNDYVYDIALVRYDPAKWQKLGEETNRVGTLSLDPMPISGPRRRNIADNMAVYAYGWGWTEATGSSSTPELRGAMLRLRSESACTQITGFTGDLLNAALCAAGSNGEQACYGDSGGPLVLYGPPDTKPVVIGVVSSGKECGVAGDPSYYTRVAAAREWIDNVMSGNTR